MTTERDHIADAALALDDEYAALSQHLHGDGDTPTAGGRLIDIKPTDVRHENGQITRDGKTYGCHVDRGDDDAPDGCVIDWCPQECDLATLPSGRTRTSRWTCKYWKPVKEPRA